MSGEEYDNDVVSANIWMGDERLEFDDDTLAGCLFVANKTNMALRDAKIMLQELRHPARVVDSSLERGD